MISQEASASSIEYRTAVIDEADLEEAGNRLIGLAASEHDLTRYELVFDTVIGELVLTLHERLGFDYQHIALEFKKLTREKEWQRDVEAYAFQINSQSAELIINAYSRDAVRFPLIEDGIALDNVQLAVPFQTQQLNQYYRDCGPACVTMVHNYMRPDKPISLTETIIQMRAVNRNTHGGDLYAFLRKKNIRQKYYSEYSAPLSRRIIRQSLRQSKPVIALVHYPDINALSDYRYSHWLVIIGYTKVNYIVHDPYLQHGLSSIPFGQLEEAMRNTKRDGNQSNQGIAIG
jgi:predicted double-glycine peptidase